MIWIFITCTLLAYVFFYVRGKYSYWKQRGIPYMKPRFLVGNTQIIPSKCWGEMTKEFYEQFPETRYHGGYMFLEPFLVLKDLDLIKQVMVKEFDHFVDRRTVVTNDVDPFWGRNLVNSQGERWRQLRSALSPSFTSSKMKMMFGLMEECARHFVDNFSKDESNEVVEAEMRDAFTRYTNDVIASAAFGLECDSFKDTENEFFKLGQDATNLGALRLFRYLVFSISPTVTRLLNIKVVPPYIARYFTKIIEDTVKLREEKNIVRPDMIHLMMEARKGGRKQEKDEGKLEGFATVTESEVLKDAAKGEITLEDIVAQAFLFFFAGFNTGSTFLSFTMYELALHPDIQERLREEINQVPGAITYEKLLGLKYLDMVVSEALRMWSPAIFTDRKVTKPFTIQPEGPGEVELTLEPGTLCMIPIWGIHRDPKYYPEPDRFDPERFNEENRHKIQPFAYIPFGGGPRNCIGSRFALLEGKLLLFYILKNFEVVPVKKTLVPMVLEPKKFDLVAKGGMWLGLKKLTK